MNSHGGEADRSKRRILVLGGGMIGSVVAVDLALEAGCEVTVSDVRGHVLQDLARRLGVRTALADLSDPAEVGRLASRHDLVVGALPSALGYGALRAVLETGRPCVDISFMADEALDLDPLARERGVTAIVDCGIAPGVSNMMVGRAVADLDSCARVEIHVGGLPVRRRWPFDYKAGFAPHDVIEEYVRPARLVENGRIVVREALSEPELIDFPEVGTLEAYTTDGLRTLLQTIDAPDMKEKTLRYPGHGQLMRIFRETGFFSKDPVDVAGQKVRPLDATAAVLFPRWTFEEGEEDLTVLRVLVEGRRGDQAIRHVWEVLDRYDSASGLRSMSRTTAFPAAIVARLLASSAFAAPGVHPPERLGRDPILFEQIMRELEARGVRIAHRRETLRPDDSAPSRRTAALL